MIPRGKSHSPDPDTGGAPARQRPASGPVGRETILQMLALSVLPILEAEAAAAKAAAALAEATGDRTEPETADGFAFAALTPQARADAAPEVGAMIVDTGRGVRALELHVIGADGVAVAGDYVLLPPEPVASAAADTATDPLPELTFADLAPPDDPDVMSG